MGRGRPIREFETYVVDSICKDVSHEKYAKSPATAFLAYCIDAKDAFLNCQNHFTRKTDRSFNKNSLTSLQHIAAGLLPSLMGHFETFERYLFAGLFENSVFLQSFDESEFFRRLKDNLYVDVSRLSAYRGLDVAIGTVLADSLTGWHSPEKVNEYFQAFGLKMNFFSNVDCERLRVLWQLRHSIVHTGGSITIPDSQKVKQLKSFGGKTVAFEENFIFEVCRKMHSIVEESVFRLRDAFVSRLRSDIVDADRQVVDSLFTVRSRVAVWLKNGKALRH
ncbi:MAG: Uncharacterized protein XE05_1766 [Thermotogales bacterium 46_20]|nr:MAG: Uncharacterized protein XE05_1766 [Thermotogales bacterium 46_20]